MADNATAHFKIGNSVHVLRHDVSGVVESRNIRMVGISYLVRLVCDGNVQSTWFQREELGSA